MMALLTGISLRTWLIVGAVGAVIAAGTYVLHSSYKAGETSATASIERANNASLDAANRAMDDIERCFQSGRDWDRSKRLCVASGGAGQ